MAETILTAQEIANHAEQAARYWAQHPKEDCPQAPAHFGPDARARWNGCFQRYLVLYSAVHADSEEQSA